MSDNLFLAIRDWDFVREREQDDEDEQAPEIANNAFVDNA